MNGEVSDRAGGHIVKTHKESGGQNGKDIVRIKTYSDGTCNGIN